MVQSDDLSCTVFPGLRPCLAFPLCQVSTGGIFEIEGKSGLFEATKKPVTELTQRIHAGVEAQTEVSLGLTLMHDSMYQYDAAAVVVV